MHENTVITEKLSTLGSYSLTREARCKNWESLVVFDTTDDVKDNLDEHWSDLQGREISQVYPTIFPDVAQHVANKKRQGSGN